MHEYRESLTQNKLFPHTIYISVPEVLLKSVSELPLLVYGRSGLLQEPKNPSKEELWQSLASPISSVYFDSANMDLYKERIKRSEGAQLFRVRWYGQKPKGNDQIFLELKTHHECWIDNKSGKMPWQDVFLSLHYFICINSPDILSAYSISERTGCTSGERYAKVN